MTKLKKSPVVFDEINHTYTLNCKSLSGVTSLLSRQMFADKYNDIPDEVLQRAAEYGSNVHERIELSDVLGGGDTDDIVALYRKIKAENDLTTLANEYLVSDEDYIASSIDIVFEGDDETYVDITDIKTTSKLDREYLSWQLSIYAYLFELQNPGIKVRNLYALWFPKPQYGTPALVMIQRIPTEIILELIETDKRGEKYSPPLIEVTETSLAIPTKAIDEVVNTINQLKKLEAKKAELQAGLLAKMNEAGIQSWKCDRLSLSLKRSSTRESVDSAILKEKYPDIYNECVKRSSVKESLNIKIF